MDIYLIRHGETKANQNGEYYGQLDVPLNQKGKTQMEKLGISLGQIDFDAIYSSPSARTLESLKLCGDHFYKKAQTDHRLLELNFGVFEGKTYEEIVHFFPEEAKRWEKDWKNFSPPNGESFVSFYSRVVFCFKEILASKKENILIMAHSGVIKAIYCYILQNNIDLYWNFTCHNGKINMIKYEYGNLFIDGMNKGGL